jgi:arylsulfatase A-like enzyme
MLTGLVASSCRPAPDAAGSPTPVLLVTIDTLRADPVAAYGKADAATPTLDALAEQGVGTEKALSASPPTLPSHATLLTGRYPSTLGVRHHGIYRLDPGETTLAETLKAAGYETAAVLGCCGPAAAAQQAERLVQGRGTS